MNIVKLSLSNLRYNTLNNIFNVFILAFGIAIIITLIHIGDSLEKRFENDIADFDLVVGAKGSPIQLILSNIFHIDIPTGNIPLYEARRIEQNPMVKFSVPLSLGDNFHGFRIVGTTPDYAKHYNAKLASGNFWKKDMQAVIGSEVARISNLQVGQKFSGAHGISEGGEEHNETLYEVVGILEPTGSVMDRLILTDVASVWRIHENHHSKGEEAGEPRGKEITALLITYKSPLATASLPRLVNQSSSMQAASPAQEMARLIQIIGFGGEAVQFFGMTLVIIAATGFFMTLFNAVNEQKYDLSLLRVLGATRNKIFSFVLSQGMALGIAGTLLGIILGHILSYSVQCWIEATRHITLGSTGFFHAYELLCAAVAIIISAIASVIPAFMAYRINVADTLSRN